MCIISINMKRDLTKKEFKSCWENNSHGAGFAWKNKFQKGFMTLEEAYQFYIKNVTGNYPHVAHFRIQTSGGTRPELTHPFAIEAMSPLKLKGTTEKGVLFHNGIISEWNNMLFNYAVAEGEYPTGALSDTRVLAMCISRGSKWIISCLNSNDKFVIFNNGVFEKWGIWEESDGVFFSNSGYKISYYRTDFLYENPYCLANDDKALHIYCQNKSCKDYDLKYYKNCKIFFTNEKVAQCKDYAPVKSKALKSIKNTSCNLIKCTHYSRKYFNNCANIEICFDGNLFLLKKACKNYACKDFYYGYENNCKSRMAIQDCSSFMEE